MQLSKIKVMLFTVMLVSSTGKFSMAASASSNQSSGINTLSENSTTTPAGFFSYVEKLKSQAKKEGISQSTIDSAFADVRFIKKVIKSDRGQLEKKINLNDYLTRVLPPSKIEQGRIHYQRYQHQLTRAAGRYPVPARYIIALWGMESHFGTIQGKEDVISALVTLAFEGRRETFFITQLMAALKVIEKIKPLNGKLTGSWAGAMGQSQFMPTSFLRYGADGDGDGRVDIWNNLNDVFASIANYLTMEGWVAGIDWGYEVKLPANFSADRAGLKDGQVQTSAYWQQQGVRLLNGNTLPRFNARTWIIIPDDIQARAFLVTDNFRTIMHWNRSYYFAISVGMMADGIGSAGLR
jgi:membrane-bound lytic murein transglycosylase B